MANENNRITIRTSSVPSGVTVSSIDTRQALEVTNNDARYYSDLAKKYKDEAKALRDDAKYYAEQNSDVTMLYVNNLEARLQGQIDGKQAVGDYALNSAIPTNVSSLNNDSNYVNSTQMNSAIDSVRLPAQTNHEGEFLSTDGDAPLWKDISELKMFDLISNDHILSYEEMKGYVPLGEYAYKEAVAGSHYGYPDFYEKCLAEYNNPNNELEIIKNNYTVVGTPIISSNGIASGLSSNTSYIIWEGNTENYTKLVIKGRQKITTDGGYFFWGNGSQNILAYNATTMTIVMRNNNNVIINKPASSFGSPTNNSWVEYEAGYTATSAYLNITYNGATYHFEPASEVVCDMTAITKIGIGGSYVGGGQNVNTEIDLKQFSITVDGVPAFSGNQTGIDTIKPDNYTIVGSPTISADGVASGFSGSNYLTHILDREISNLKLSLCFTTNSITSGTSQFICTGGNGGRFQCYINENKYLQIWFGNVTEWVVRLNDLYLVQENTKYKVDIITSPSKVEVYLNENLIKTISVENFSFNFSTIYLGSRIYGATNPFSGSIDLNSFKIHVDGNLVYQPCLKIPYTESNTGVKVVDTAYRGRVEDMYEQFGYSPYCMSDEYHEIVTYNAVDCIRTNPNGHKFYDISNKPEIDDIYDDTGSAWFYGVDINRERILLPRREDTNNLQNTYMVVGNTTSWTGMTSVVNQGMTLLEQVNKGMSNVALSRLDLDVSNISSDGKSRVIDWLMPDYTLGINFTSVPYTAPSNGICYVSTGAANTTSIITVNGITVGQVGIHDGNMGSVSILVNPGDVINGTGNYGTPNGWFFPFKGV